MDATAISVTADVAVATPPIGETATTMTMAPAVAGTELIARTGEAWPGEAALLVIGKAVSRKYRLFDAYADVTRDDLLQDALIHCRAAWPRFDSARASWVTYLYTVASTKCLMVARARGRTYRRERAMARTFVDATRGLGESADAAEWDAAGASADDVAGGGLGALLNLDDDGGDHDDARAVAGAGLGDGGESLEEWAGRMYRTAVRTFPAAARSTHRPPRRGGRAWFDPAQMVVATLVRRRRRLSIRNAVLFFEQCPGLRAALRLRHAPGRDWFHRAHLFAQSKLRKAAGPKPPSPLAGKGAKAPGPKARPARSRGKRAAAVIA